MSNTQAPFGFRGTGLSAGFGPNFGTLVAKMVASESNAAFFGDMFEADGSNAGYVVPVTSVTSGGQTVAGVACGYKWTSIARSMVTWDKYYPGSDAVTGTTVEVHLDANPQSVFEVQSNGAVVTQADVGKYANFVLNSGNTFNGLSGMALDPTTINATQGSLPLLIVGIVGAPKSDPTSSYNTVQVRLVNLNSAL